MSDIAVICGERAHACVCGLPDGHDGPHVCLKAPFGVTCGGSWFHQDSEEGVVSYPSIASMRAGMRAVGFSDGFIEARTEEIREFVPADKLIDTIDVSERLTNGSEPQLSEG